MVTRQRQVKRGAALDPSSSADAGDAGSPRRGRPMLRAGRFPRRAPLAVAAVMGLFLVYVGLNQYADRAIDSLAVSLSLHKPFHVVVIDAGSTASRVIAFTFHRSLLNGKFELDDELYFETKPGLSAYATRPQDVRGPLELLLEKARTRVPAAERARTPLLMRATAGLRLLPGQQAQNILAESRRVLGASGFLLAERAVEIMDGSDEGLFSWFSVNFLIGRFDGPAGSGSGDVSSQEEYARGTVAALDLGGGSTQVTFALRADEVGQSKAEVRHVNAFGRNLTVYARSFLGMGLMAARKAVLTHPDNFAGQSALPDLVAEGPIELHAECVNPIVAKAEWAYGDKKYLVSGPVNGSHKLIKSQGYVGLDEDMPIVRFPVCLDIVQKVVNASVPRGLPSFLHHDIYAFSYYFDRATEAGLIDPFTGGVITLKAFYKAAQDACQYANTEQPFTCLDLTFIYVLLHDGFGIDDSNEIFLRKKINGHELSWALGAAFNVLDPNS